MDSPEPASAKPVPSLLRRWLREPLLHVLLIGATLFVVYYALNPKRRSAPGFQPHCDYG